jgi:hypothetical protein
MNTKTLLLIYEVIYLMNLTYAIISVVNNLKLVKFESYQSIVPYVTYTTEVLACQLFIFELKRLEIILQGAKSSEEYSVKLEKIHSNYSYRNACMVSSFIQMIEIIVNNIWLPKQSVVYLHK